MTGMEAIAGTDNPYSLMQVLGKGHSVVKASSTVYVMQCQSVSVQPRREKNCTHEIPASFDGQDIFVDPISFVIKLVGTIVHCNDVTPPRYLIAGKWYSGYQELRECHAPDTLPRTPLGIGDLPELTGLGCSVYKKEQMDDFIIFQHAAGARSAFLAQQTVLAFSGRESGAWQWAKKPNKC